MDTRDTYTQDTSNYRPRNAPSDERLLVAQAKSGHSGAFGELYQRYQLKLYRSTFRILRNQQDAEDAVQLCFQHAFASLAKFRGDSTFSTWITRIAINEALMLLRQRRMRSTAFEAQNVETHKVRELETADERSTPEEVLAQIELRDLMFSAVYRLRRTLRSVVLLRELQGLSSEETARRLGLTVAAVKARVFHARRHLRRHLTKKCRLRRRDIVPAPTR